MKIILLLVSYYFPITRKVGSLYSGVLELRFSDGRLLLDSAYANYSYGTLQKVLEFAISKIDLLQVRSVLLLGLGGGCVIKSLRRRFNYKSKIVAIDIDPLVISLAKSEFGIRSNHKTTIVWCEASKYLKNEPKRSDLVIVDLSIDDEVPKDVLLPDFWIALRDKVSPNGYVIFNAMHIADSKTNLVINELKKWGFSVEGYNHIERYNTVLIAKSCIGSWFG